MEIPISAKALALFLLGGPSKKATIVRNILKPRSKEAMAVALYYSGAIAIIRIYHSRNNDKAYLHQAREALNKKLEKAPNPQSRSKLQNNLRALDAYLDVYGSRKRKIVPRPRIYYKSGRVRVSASPDLAVEENGKLKLVKLGVTKDADNPEVVRVMLRLIYRAAKPKLPVEPHDVVYFDITNSARIRGSHSDADLETTIENGCNALEAMC